MVLWHFSIMTTAAAGNGHAAACLSSKLSPNSGPNNTGSFFDSPQPSQTDVGTESHGDSQGDRSSTRESTSNPRLAEETDGGSNGDRSSTNESSGTPLPEVLWGGHLSQDPWARKTILSFGKPLALSLSCGVPEEIYLVLSGDGSETFTSSC